MFWDLKKKNSRSKVELFDGKLWAGVDRAEDFWDKPSIIRKFKPKDVTLFKSNTYCLQEYCTFSIAHNKNKILRVYRRTR